MLIVGVAPGPLQSWSLFLTIMEITQSSLQELLDYDPETGVFVWKVGSRRGKVAGFVQSGGYIQICIEGKNYYAHRLAWLYAHGESVPTLLDHMDGDRSNNRVANLRPSSFRQNGENQRAARSDNSTGLLGVSKKRGKWRAAIKVDGKTRHIGTFDTPEAAHAAYVLNKRRLHEGCTI